MIKVDSDWKKGFDQRTLEKGKEYAGKGQVVNLKETPKGVAASVTGTRLWNVELVLRAGRLVQKYCTCPKARGGRPCEHMAAVLWSLSGDEKEPKAEASREKGTEGYQMSLKDFPGEPAAETEGTAGPAPADGAAAGLSAEEQARRDERRKAREQRKAEKAKKLEEKREKEAQQRLKDQERRQAEEARRQEQRRKKEEEARRKEEKRRREQEQQRLAQGQNIYHYYDGAAILDSLHIPETVYETAQKFVDEGKAVMDHSEVIYHAESGKQAGMVFGSVDKGKNTYQVSLKFDRKNVFEWTCNCPDCRWMGSSYYIKLAGRCSYVAAVAIKLKAFLDIHSFGDATDYSGSLLLNNWRAVRENAVIAEKYENEGVLNLEPKIVKKERMLRLVFRVGRDKLYVVKDLKTFCRQIRRQETAVYGTSTKITHTFSHFTEKGKSWIRFLEQVRQDEEDLKKRNDGFDLDVLETSLGGYVPLSGWRLDAFYQELGEEAVEFEDRDEKPAVKGSLRCGTGEPRGTLRLSEMDLSGEEESSKKNPVFHGLRVEGILPQFYHGAQALYYLSKDYLCRVEDNLRESLRMLEPLMHGSSGFTFCVGRQNLADFYYKLLPELEKIFQIQEDQAQKYRSYLPPQAQYRFWLDADEWSVTCKAEVLYGERVYSLLDLCTMPRAKMLEQQRDIDGELAVYLQLKAWLPLIDLKQNIAWVDGETDEDEMLDMLQNGADALMQLGEVQVTQDFRRKQRIHPFKMSVGVSVSRGMLDLNIATEDLTPQELLDVLKNYRAKRHYYRLKSGDYMRLDESALAMLFELMNSARIPDKEFLRGNLHIPLFRTLYLDQLLEEHSEVYNDRDAHFRQIVRGFKTVNEADFEVPQSLKKILRPYQVSGYKWLRTLEAWGFGGILADDMGLGKTLQAIAVLLAEKEEGRAGTSLVVTPAALVFNWGEELKRFAPELSVRLVAGTQEERRKILETPAAQQADVLVTSYDLLKRDITLYEGKEFCCQIIDEAQYIKNHTTAAAKAVKVIHSRTRYALTGTPIENRLSELWSIFDYLMPGFLYAYETFRREMETPIVKHQDGDVMKRLQKLTGPFILRRLKTQVLKDLPEKLEENYYVSFEAEQRTLYDAQLVHMKTVLASQDDAEFRKNRMQILAELTKLRQICCSPELCFENFSGNSAKEDTCLELVRSAIDGGHRILLFSQFASMLALLKQRFDREKIPCYLLTGDTPKQERQELVRQFNEGDVPLFLISLKAGGVGLNLTGADVVIHYDPWWNVAAQNQATDRAHRIGQTRAVTVYKLLAKDTIEEKIQELQEKKRDLAEQVIEGETGQLAGMTREDLMELLAVAPG